MSVLIGLEKGEQALRDAIPTIAVLHMPAGRVPHRGAPHRVAKEAGERAAYRRGIGRLDQQPGPRRHEFREGAPGGNDHGARAGHRLQGGQPEGLVLGEQRENIGGVVQGRHGARPCDPDDPRVQAIALGLGAQRGRLRPLAHDDDPIGRRVACRTRQCREQAAHPFARLQRADGDDHALVRRDTQAPSGHGAQRGVGAEMLRVDAQRYNRAGDAQMRAHGRGDVRADGDTVRGVVEQPVALELEEAAGRGLVGEVEDDAIAGAAAG